MSRLRVIGFTVQPQFMVDDGENLTPLPVDPLNIPAAQWSDVLEIVASGVEQLRAQVESPPLTVVDEAASA